VSLSFALLTGAVLLLESLRGIRNVDPGFTTQGVLMTRFDLESAGYDEQRTRAFQDRLIDRVQALAGVQSAAFVRVAPFTYPSYSSAPVAVEGYAPAPDEQTVVEYDEVG